MVPVDDNLDALVGAVGRWLAARGAHAGNVLALARIETRLFARLAVLVNLLGNPWLAAGAVLAALAAAVAGTLRTLVGYTRHMRFAVTRQALGRGPPAKTGTTDRNPPTAATCP